MGLLALLLAFAGCQRGVDEYDESPQANVEALWRMIDEHYCFLDYKEQSLGFSWAGKREEYLGMVRPGMSRSQLFEVLCRMLSTLKDGHVNIYSSMDVGRNWSWKDDYPENLDRELRDKYLGTDYGIASGMKYRILDDNIGYVVYESFSDGIGEGNLDEVLYYLRTASYWTYAAIRAVCSPMSSAWLHASPMSARWWATSHTRQARATMTSPSPGQSTSVRLWTVCAGRNRSLSWSTAPASALPTPLCGI